MIKKIDEKSHQTQQSQKCISFSTSIAVPIHFFQFLKSYRSHLALWVAKFLNDELFRDSKYPELKRDRNFVSNDTVLRENLLKL
jgi:hypothetical protein